MTSEVPRPTYNPLSRELTNDTLGAILDSVEADVSAGNLEETAKNASQAFELARTIATNTRATAVAAGEHSYAKHVLVGEALGKLLKANIDPKDILPWYYDYISRHHSARGRSSMQRPYEEALEQTREALNLFPVLRPGEYFFQPGWQDSRHLPTPIDKITSWPILQARQFGGSSLLINMFTLFQTAGTEQRAKDLKKDPQPLFINIDCLSDFRFGYGEITSHFSTYKVPEVPGNLSNINTVLLPIRYGIALDATPFAEQTVNTIVGTRDYAGALALRIFGLDSGDTLQPAPPQSLVGELLPLLTTFSPATYSTIYSAAARASLAGTLPDTYYRVFAQEKHKTNSPSIPQIADTYNQLNAHGQALADAA